MTVPTHGKPQRRAHTLEAREAAAEIAAGRLTSRALVEDCLARITEREPVLKAWTHVAAEQALEQARALDMQAAAGCLHGLPIGLKDVIDARGIPTTCGSPIHHGHIPAVDAGCVAMGRRAGAIVLGKTVTAEFAASQPGPTVHPHNPRHTPGGSSSGSAAAVADGMVPLALGTQTGGSIIRPASFCGVVGFKPSRGLISRYGVKQLADTLDTVGSFARSVGDTALLVAGLTGRSDFLDIAAARPTRVSLCRSADWDQAEAGTLAALDATLALLARHGVAVSEIDLPARFAALPHAHHTIEYFELARALQHEYRSHRDQLSAAIVSRIETGLACEPALYESALALRRECQALIDQIFGDADLLLAPSAPGEAPEGLHNTGKAVFNRLWTLLTLPCITLPGHRGPAGLPIGVQFIARRRQDAGLLAQAAWIEDAIRRRPQ